MQVVFCSAGNSGSFETRPILQWGGLCAMQLCLGELGLGSNTSALHLPATSINVLAHPLHGMLGTLRSWLLLCSYKKRNWECDTVKDKGLAFEFACRSCYRLTWCPPTNALPYINNTVSHLSSIVGSSLSFTLINCLSFTPRPSLRNSAQLCNDPGLCNTHQSWQKVCVCVREDVQGTCVSAEGLFRSCIVGNKQRVIIVSVVR